MLLKYFYDKKLAQASYMVGCAATGEALIVDPSRDIAPFLDAAQAEGLCITHVTETHIHADYVSGSRELAAETGAYLYLSDMGDANWKYSIQGERIIQVLDGDSWMVGNIKVEVIHTPGHTPEHIALMITDTAAANEPIGIFTGDFLFVGDVGRPDLLEEAAGMIGTKERGARQQFRTVARFKDMPDYLQIWPGHGAGSACGKALGALPSTTLGYEKRFNPAFQFADEDQFVTWLLDGQPEAPHYFAQMKHVNKVGPELLRNIAMPEKMDRKTLDQLIEQKAFILDMRTADEFARAYVPGTINIPDIGGGCVNYVGWFVNYQQPTYVIADENTLDSILKAFRTIGIDNVAGYFPTEVISQGITASMQLVKASELSQQIESLRAVILDVRGLGEYSKEHIVGAMHIPLGYLPRHLDQIPRDQTVITQCASGYRSQIAASLLRSYGFNNVINLRDNKAEWEKVLPIETNFP